MESLARVIDGFSEQTGRIVAWLALALVLLQFSLVVLRYIFGINDRAFEELLLYFHGILFLLAAAYTLKHQGHVRVDLLYRDAPERTKAWINLAGSLLFLLPVCGLIAWAAWPFVESAWIAKEGSTESSGLPFKYIYKSVILVFVAMMALQGVAQAIQAWLVLKGRAEISEPDVPAL